MNQERSEISHHEVRIFNFISNEPKWRTNNEVAHELSMPGRTVRSHMLRFVQLGLVDQAEVFPAHRYRWSEKSAKRNISYLQRLKMASEVFAE